MNVTFRFPAKNHHPSSSPPLPRHSGDIEREIAEVLNWLLLTFNKAETPAGFKPYTAAEVAKYRPHQLIEITETRDRLVKQLKAKGLVVPDDQLAGEALAAPLARP